MRGMGLSGRKVRSNFICVGFGEGFECADDVIGFVDMLEKEQVTLVWEETHHFVVFPKCRIPSSEL